MRVRLLTGIASPTWSYGPGEVAEIEPEEAVRWIRAGIAEPAEAAAETATVTAPETTAKPRPRPRKPK